MRFELNRWECVLLAFSLTFAFWMTFMSGKLAGHREAREIRMEVARDR